MKNTSYFNHLRFLGFFYFIFISSCSYVKYGTINSASSENISNLKKAPISVSLNKAYIIEKKILLKIELSVLSDISAKETVVGVNGLKEGNLIEEQYVILSDIVSRNKLVDGERVLIEFVLESGVLSEFQIKAYWGEDGKRVIKEKIYFDDINKIESENIFSLETKENESINKNDKFETISQEDSHLLPPEPRRPNLNEALETNKYKQVLEIIDLEIHENDIVCEKIPCPKKVRLKGKLKNSSKQILTSISLAFGIHWVFNGQLPKLPDELSPIKVGEEKLSFGSKFLEVNEVIEFEIDIDRAIYQIPGGYFMPHVRVLSFEKLRSK